MANLEREFRHLQMVCTPPTDARDARLALHQFAQAADRVSSTAGDWSTDIRTAALGKSAAKLEEVLSGKEPVANDAANIPGIDS